MQALQCENTLQRTRKAPLFPIVGPPMENIVHIMHCSHIHHIYLSLFKIILKIFNNIQVYQYEYNTEKKIEDGKMIICA